MRDSRKTIARIKNDIARFIRERDWEQFHSPKNLSMAITIEAAELMEIFQWMNVDEALFKAKSPRLRKRIQEEIADIAIYTLSLCNTLGLDLSGCIASKLDKNRRKYPVHAFRGRW
jgi:NTP pyrophosphatase (non-canonical NTP hydrolase)